MARDLLDPILEEGIRNINFFNGRLLTAEDLQAEQEANRAQHRQLGRAVGEGVVGGLEVRLAEGAAGRTNVSVTAGRALNRQGQVLSLPRPVEVVIAPEEEPTASGDGLFVDCSPFATVLPSGTGAYLLVLAPASGPAERAPRVGLGDGGVARSCDSRYVVEGVRFRLLPLDVESRVFVPDTLAEPIGTLVRKTTRTAPEQSCLRNLLAHLCLGTAEAAGHAADLYGRLGRGAAGLTYGPLDQLREAASVPEEGRLTDCDVPLALLYWTTDRIAFVDMWSVRRRVHRLPGSSHPPFPALDRRAAEGEAAFLQFQQHIAELAAPGIPQSRLDLIRAVEHFRYLPAIGLLPERAGTARGLGHLSFFQGLTVRAPVFIDGTKMQPLVQHAFAYRPIDLEQKELLWLYRVRENRQTAAAGGLPALGQAYLVFAGGHLPYQGDAQYDLARWNYSNYGPGVAGLLTHGG